MNAPSRLDRELNELLQELRVIQGGILLLLGFLLVVAFSSAFQRVSDFQRLVYFLTLSTTGASVLVVVAPVVHHRMAFRRFDKERVLVRGNFQLLIAIIMVAVSILGIVVLVTDFLYGKWVMIPAASAHGVLTILLWWVLPRHSIKLAAREYEHAGGH